MHISYCLQLRWPIRFKAYLRRGFTLIEVLIVVILLGILAAIVIPVFASSNQEAEDSVAVTNLRYAARQIVFYHAKNGAYPPDRLPGQMPAGMEVLLGGMDWTEPTPIGGQWDWDYQTGWCTAGVSLHGPDRTAEEMRVIDEMVDDGDLGTGGFRARAGGYVLIIRP
ncbi:MAG: prepilin-type N-terminal cleavage/methylation domain-containing protein [Planctomycetes bacterium]|jgi:prepilin-type N-terminal cleavage/methylation domain-containing protein|nr:prepilin-type N-terminal cleavage/methylation domain-containing protein [Phycisphaerae bacterium]NBB94908.1 prepilin-type N-terminal cleavage/methylation domain-containing protein [Planctomycetota bacterium]